MRTRTTPIVAIAATAGLLFAGSAAGAIPSAPGAGPRRPADAPSRRPAVRVGSGRVSFGPVGKGFPNPKFPAAKKGTTSNDAFSRLGATAFAAYGTGTVLHSDPELAGPKAAVTIDMATADAAYAGQELSAFADELGRAIVPALPAGNGRAQARALKVDPPDAAGDIETGDPAEATAPPTGRPVVKTTEAHLDPIVKADALRAEAHARAVPTGCVIGSDLARADATADDTDIADTDPKPNSTKPLLSLGADDPTRAVSHSASRIRLVPTSGQPGRFGAVSETRQTIAPITFGLPGVDDKFTIEVGGEWVMRASSDGTKGIVSFGPENSNDDDRPAIRLIHGKDVFDEVGLRDIGGRTGIFYDGDPVGDIRIGGDPRAILGRPESKPTQTPTRVSAAADVVVVRLFEPHAELHIGHMEVGLAVPSGGVPCPGVNLKKTSNPASVRPGDPFSWNIEVSNPNDCVLDKIKVTDLPTPTAGVNWKALASVPRATRAADGSLLFDALGPIATGERKTLTINAEIEPGSPPGTITNRAIASGVCGNAPLGGTAETITSVGPAALPALRSPGTGVSGNERQGQGPPAATSGEADSSARGAPASTQTSSARLARSAAAAGSRTAAAKSEPARPRTATGAGVLPRSGADSAPYVALAIGLLGTGSVFRRARTRLRR